MINTTDISISDYRHPDEFPTDVQLFFAADEQRSVENSACWYRNLINAVYPSDEGIHIYVLRKNGLPVLALPIRVTQAGTNRLIDSLSNYYTALYAPLTKKDIELNDMIILISAIKNAHAPVQSMRFAPMDPDSANFGKLITAIKAAGLMPFKFFRFGNWYLQVKDGWATYLKNRDGTVRSTIKRMGKKFLADGGTLELIQGGDRLERGVAAYEHVYAMSWKQPEPFPSFIPGLIRVCAEQGWLRLGVAWLNGQPIASQLWIVANGKANIYKLAYDKNFKMYASGTLLTAMLMEQAITSDQVDEIDYLMGDDSYKTAWMSHRRERWGIIAYNPKSVSGLMSICKEIAGRTVKTLIARIKKP